MRLVAFVITLSACASPASPEHGGGDDTQDDKDDDGTQTPSSTDDFDVNDVSILVPLPQTLADRVNMLWLVPEAGEQGPYFPADAADMLGPLNGDVPDSFGYPSSMVVGIRFDHCFVPLGSESCQAQLRLVAQPVLLTNAGPEMLEDAAAHLFYALGDDEAADVIAELVAIRAGSPVSTSGPLGIHPGLAVDLAGATGDRVRALVVAHAREDNLVRITTNAFTMDNWGFRKFDRIDGALVAQPIAGLVAPDRSQSWLRQAQRDSLDDPSGTIVPAPANGFTYLLSASSYAGSHPVDPTAARAAAERLLAIENPEVTTTEDTDCASCHLASQARLFAERHGVSFDGGFAPPAGTSSGLVLTPDLQGNLGATISFGYHTRNAVTSFSVPSISQRTVNESAQVAAHLRAL